MNPYLQLTRPCCSSYKNKVWSFFSRVLFHFSSPNMAFSSHIKTYLHLVFSTSRYSVSRLPLLNECKTSGHSWKEKLIRTSGSVCLSERRLWWRRSHFVFSCVVIRLSPVNRRFDTFLFCFGSKDESQLFSPAFKRLQLQAFFLKWLKELK